TTGYLRDHEAAFVEELLQTKPYRIYRTPDGAGLGDFVIINWVDKSENQAEVWIVELKSGGASSARSSQVNHYRLKAVALEATESRLKSVTRQSGNCHLGR
ncbi:MAG TPA: hypothetical protein VHD90_12200, partial [Phototrophicaceae bacterium]|nr:hypothetical protein [Phototrophicaceae bacterium]